MKQYYLQMWHYRIVVLFGCLLLTTHNNNNNNNNNNNSNNNNRRHHRASSFLLVVVQAFHSPVIAQPRTRRAAQQQTCFGERYHFDFQHPPTSTGLNTATMTTKTRTRRQSPSSQRYMVMDNNNFYNDFGSSNDGSNEDNTNEQELMQALSQRITISKLKQEQQFKRIQQNLMDGNWSVRGFTLDKFNSLEQMKNQQQSAQQDDPRSTTAWQAASVSTFDDPVEFMMSSSRQQQQQEEENDIPIVVTKIIFLDDTNKQAALESESVLQPRIAVGRSDGSVLIIKLGSEYIAQFQSIPSVEMDDETLMVNYQSKLVRAEDNPAFPNASPSDDLSSQGGNHDNDDAFEILSQFRISNRGDPINEMFFDGNDLYISSSSSNEIQRWSLQFDEDELDVSSTPRHVMSYNYPSPTSHSTIVGIHSLELSSSSLLITVSSNGTFVVWDRDTGSILKNIQVNVNGDCQIYSSTLYQTNETNLLLLGLDNGHVIGYSLAREDLLSDHQPPCLDFLAHQGRGTTDGTSYIDGSPITSIQCFLPPEEEDSNRSGSSNTIALVTGGQDGLVKQWELFPRSTNKYEHWPRMANQRLKGRAHILDGHDHTITALALSTAEINIVISASKEGRIIVWDGTTGEALYRMDGFTSVITSVCFINNQLLVTNGMQNVVSLHDFDNVSSLDDLSNDYTLEF